MLITKRQDPNQNKARQQNIIYWCFNTFPRQGSLSHWKTFSVSELDNTLDNTIPVAKNDHHKKFWRDCVPHLPSCVKISFSYLWLVRKQTFQILKFYPKEREEFAKWEVSSVHNLLLDRWKALKLKMNDIKRS